MPQASDNGDLQFATVTELGGMLRARNVSSVELTKLFLDRLETYGPQFNALALSLRKESLKTAKDIDDDMKRQRFRSALHGIPYAVKDLLAVEGHPTTWGAKPFEQQVFEEDASVVTRLRKVGSVLIGKLSMVELAGGGGYNTAAASLQGPGLNPWNKQHWSGGSSSGSGAAVAAGLVPYALGSETSGSILTPAAFCGVSGLRPTYGLVSRHGAMALSWSLDKIGVLARSADDCGLVLQSIAGKDDNDAASARKSFYYAPQWSRQLRDVKVGFAEIDFAGWADEPLRPAYAKALTIVKALGPQMRPKKLPDFPYGPVISTIIDVEAASIFESLIRDGRIDQLADPVQVAGLKASLNYSALDYLKAMRIRTQIQKAFRELFADVDLLVAPTRFSVAARADVPFDVQDKANDRKKPEEMGVGSGLIPASNLCGLPALSIPCGVVNGLPIGLQIVGPPFSENSILALGREFQKLSDYHRQRPTLA